MQLGEENPVIRISWDFTSVLNRLNRGRGGEGRGREGKGEKREGEEGKGEERGRGSRGNGRGMEVASWSTVSSGLPVMYVHDTVKLNVLYTLVLNHSSIHKLKFTCTCTTPDSTHPPTHLSMFLCSTVVANSG